MGLNNKLLKLRNKSELHCSYLAPKGNKLQNFNPPPHIAKQAIGPLHCLHAYIAPLYYQIQNSRPRSYQHIIRKRKQRSIEKDFSSERVFDNKQQLPSPSLLPWSLGERREKGDITPRQLK